ncbi:MAG: hypothetical protein M1831_007364 [Alyxoria varia]|nr:MAG: hypothetical protein M1831_007364 [Alyxoria varia]
MKFFYPWSGSFLLAGGTLIFAAAATPPPWPLSYFPELWQELPSDPEDPGLEAKADSDTDTDSVSYCSADSGTSHYASAQLDADSDDHRERLPLQPNRQIPSEIPQSHSQESSVPPADLRYCHLRGWPPARAGGYFYGCHIHAYGMNSDYVNVDWQYEFKEWLVQKENMHVKLHGNNQPLRTALDTSNSPLLYRQTQGPEDQLIAVSLHIDPGLPWNIFTTILLRYVLHVDLNHHLDCLHQLSKYKQKGVPYVGQPNYSLKAFDLSHHGEDKRPGFWINIFALSPNSKTAHPVPNYRERPNEETEQWTLSVDPNAYCALRPPSD